VPLAQDVVPNSSSSEGWCLYVLGHVCAIALGSWRQLTESYYSHQAA
jgi:hypothetical protein